VKFKSNTRIVGGRTLLLCFLVLMLPLPVLQAQEASPEAPPSRPAEESLLILDAGDEAEGAETGEVQGGPLVSSWDFLRMVLILAAVVGVIYLIFWLLKRGFRRQLPQNDLIRLLGTRNLSGNRALHLVEMGKQVFLVGWNARRCRTARPRDSLNSSSLS
jgi:flagellar protein FliO/FliZ